MAGQSVLSGWLFGEGTKWVLQEKMASFSGDSFSVKDANGHVVLKGDGSALSIGDKVTMIDPRNGQTVCILKQEKMHMHQHFVVKRPDGSVALTIRKKMLSLKDDIRVYAGDANFSLGMKTEAPQLLQLSGSLTGRNFKIKDPATGTVLATSHEKRFNIGGIISDKDEYCVEVSPNVDVVMILASLIVMDCMQENK